MSFIHNWCFRRQCSDETRNWVSQGPGEPNLQTGCVNQVPLRVAVAIEPPVPERVTPPSCSPPTPPCPHEHRGAVFSFTFCLWQPSEMFLSQVSGAVERVWTLQADLTLTLTGSGTRTSFPS